MAPPKVNFTQLTPVVLNQSAPVPLTFEAHLASPADGVKIFLDYNSTFVALIPDASGTVFTGTVPAAALLTNFTASDVQRAYIGHLLVTLGPNTDQYNLFGDVLSANIPPAPIKSAAPDVQWTDHLVNIMFPALADDFDQIFQFQFTTITQKFYAHFDDDYDFLHVIFASTHNSNRFHAGARNDVQGIGMQPFNNSAQYGSAGRLLGVSIFPYPWGYDGASPTVVHETGHQWINQLHFPPFQQGIPHWPLSDLAEDVMGFSIFVNGQPEGGQFDFDLQPVGGGNYKMVPNNNPKSYSDLSLYLMGMVPANQVGTHFVFDNQGQAIVANGILQGPVTQVTVNDVIANTGSARLPAAAQAQHRFRVATILVTKNALASADTMALYEFFSARAAAKTQVPFHDGFLKGNTNPFRLATKGIGRLDPRIKRHILIDASRDGGVWWFPQSGSFDPAAPHQGKSLAAHLRSLGHTVTELHGPLTITPMVLADFDIVIRVNSKGVIYNAAEISAYDAWVQDGGGLLLLSESFPQDALALHLGLKFQGNALGKQKLSQFAAHPLTAGVGPLNYSGGSGLTAHPPSATVLGWLSPDTFLDLNGSGVKDPSEPWAPAALGVMPFGLGRIAFCGDCNLWEQVPQPLIKNTLRYFTGP